MKTSRAICIVFLLLLTGGAGWFWWKKGEPRRTSIQVLQSFHKVLMAGQGNELLNSLVLPRALQGRTSEEQVEFLTKVLRDEISADGIAALKREGVFGPFPDVFPAEAATWANQAGVAPGSCLAFRMEKNGLRAEVVLLSSQSGYRIIRCNNVKQMADAKP